MSELNVRGLDADTLARLSAKAKLAGQSRESYIRDMLVHEAVVQSVDFKTQWVREGGYPFPDGSAEDRLLGKGFVHGFLTAVRAGLTNGSRNGIPERDVMAVLGIGAPEAPRSPAPTPAAAPHGIQVISHEYTVGGP